MTIFRKEMINVDFTTINPERYIVIYFANVLEHIVTFESELRIRTRSIQNNEYYPQIVFELKFQIRITALTLSYTLFGFSAEKGINRFPIEFVPVQTFESDEKSGFLF